MFFQSMQVHMYLDADTETLLAHMASPLCLQIQLNVILVFFDSQVY